MIVNREEHLIHSNYKKMTKELPQYRKAAVYLKKQIKLKDSRGQKLKNYHENIIKSPQDINISNSRKLTVLPAYQQHDLHHKKQIASETLVREKSYPSHLINPEQNLFKNGSSFAINKKRKNDLKLPSLQKKSIFHGEQQQTIEEEVKPKVVKVSVNKLIKLKPEDVRKKFESKFKMASSEPLPP